MDNKETRLCQWHTVHSCGNGQGGAANSFRWHEMAQHEAGDEYREHAKFAEEHQEFNVKHERAREAHARLTDHHRKMMVEVKHLVEKLDEGI
jgi:hypothetical protein